MSLSLTPIPAALALWLLAMSAPAEGAPPARTAPEASAANTAVAAEQTPRRSAVGRKVYAVPRDLANGGSVSDVLRTLPFVEIDAEGEVSLRGDPNVTILVDGQTSIFLSAGSRALALQQMPASTVESIEVMTGASAQFPSAGAGGVINIVSKMRKPGSGL